MKEGVLGLFDDELVVDSFSEVGLFDLERKFALNAPMH